MLTRRALLSTGTASVVVLGISGATVNASRHARDFRAPWAQASEGFGDVRLNALAYAILAPNPHNRQPWRVHLHDDGLSYDLYCDLDRVLPLTDPPNRQITIGLGAFLELYEQAAAAQGYATEMTSFPDGEPFPILDERRIATVTIKEDSNVSQSPLFAHALARRTVRANFDQGRLLSETDMARLVLTADLSAHTGFSFSVDPARLDRLKDLSRRGWEVETSAHHVHQESTDLTRIGAKEVAANPDGISLYGPMMEAYNALGLLRRDKMNTPGTSAHKGAVSWYNKLIDSGVAYGWLSTPTNSRVAQLQAGADWVRLNLAATQLGIAMQPISQVLQEFPEMDALYAEFHQEVGIGAPARVQGLFRFGYAKYPKPSPRWPLESRLSQV